MFASPEAEPRKPVIGRGIVAVLVILLLAGGLVYVVNVIGGPASSRPSNGIATGVVDGRQVAVVPYEIDTVGTIDLPRMDSMGLGIQVEAFDLDTGERFWDMTLFNDFDRPGADALAVGEGKVYVRTDLGLVILEASTGEILSTAGDISGLGEDYIASRGAYDWDRNAQAVVLLTASGEVRMIKLGSTTAVPATADVAGRWWTVLNTQELENPYSASTDGVTESQNEQVRAELRAGHPVRHATVSAAGHVVMISANDDDQGLLVVATATGIRTSVIGTRTVFGW